MRIQLNAQQHDDEQKQEQARQERLERFLADVTKPVAQFGETTQKEWRMEAEQHIQERAKAYKELGEDAETALKHAIRDFGNARQVGESVAKKSVHWWQRSFLRGVARGLLGGLFTIPVWLFVYTMLVLPISHAIYGQTNSWASVMTGFALVLLVPGGTAAWVMRMPALRTARFFALLHFVFVIVVLMWLYSLAVAKPVPLGNLLNGLWQMFLPSLLLIGQGALIGFLLGQIRQVGVSRISWLRNKICKPKPPAPAR